MDLTWKHIYVKTIHARYLKAHRTQKKIILDEFCKTYRCHRKHAIRLLNRPVPSVNPPPRRNGRQRRYKGHLVKVLEAVWEASYSLWSARLKAALPTWMPWIRQRFPLTMSTLSTWHVDSQNPVKQLEKKLQKERFLGTL